MRALSRLIQVSAVIAISFVLTGCATTPTVGYVSKAPKQASKNVSLWIQSFTDARSSSEKGVLGGIYNGYNMRMGDVIEPAGMIDSIKKSFESELESAGYAIAADSRDLVATVELVSIACDNRTQSAASIHARIKLSDKGTKVLDKVYTGKANAFVLIGFATSQALNGSIQKVASEWIKDLDEYIKT